MASSMRRGLHAAVAGRAHWNACDGHRAGGSPLALTKHAPHAHLAGFAGATTGGTTTRPGTSRWALPGCSYGRQPRRRARGHAPEARQAHHRLLRQPAQRRQAGARRGVVPDHHGGELARARQGGGHVSAAQLRRRAVRPDRQRAWRGGRSGRGRRQGGGGIGGQQRGIGRAGDQRAGWRAAWLPFAGGLQSPRPHRQLQRMQHRNRRPGACQTGTHGQGSPSCHACRRSASKAAAPAPSPWPDTTSRQPVQSRLATPLPAAPAAADGCSSCCSTWQRSSSAASAWAAARQSRCTQLLAAGPPAPAPASAAAAAPPAPLLAAASWAAVELPPASQAGSAVSACRTVHGGCQSPAMPSTTACSSLQAREPAAREA